MKASVRKVFKESQVCLIPFAFPDIVAFGQKKAFKHRFS